MVNTASRMESYGMPDRIHTTREFYEAARHEFHFESRGIMLIKGKGELETYFLNESVKSPRPTEAGVT